MFRTSHVFDIHHSFFRLDGFAGNGHEALVGETFPTTMSQAVPFKGRQPVGDRSHRR